MRLYLLDKLQSEKIRSAVFHENTNESLSRLGCGDVESAFDSQTRVAIIKNSAQRKHYDLFMQDAKLVFINGG